MGKLFLLSAIFWIEESSAVDSRMSLILYIS